MRSREEPADASIASLTAEWESGDGGVVTFTVTLTNLTDQDLDLTASVPSDESCGVSLAPSSLSPNQPPTKVEIGLGAECDTSEGKLAVAIEAGNASFNVSAAEPDAPDTPWTQLRVFYVILAGAALVALVAMGVLRRKRWWKPLEGLKADWDFKDAWATNVTALGAILTGVVGSSSVVKSILGEDAEKSIALATVGAAIAAALALTAPIVLFVFKREGSYTLLGVLLANMFVVSAAFGELWLVSWSGTRLENFGTSEDVAIYAAAGGAAALLLAYVVVNTLAVWREGTKATKKAEPSVELVAAALHLRYCCDVEEIDADEFTKIREHLKVLVNASEDEGDGEPSTTASTRSFDGSPAIRALVAPERGIGI